MKLSTPDAGHDEFLTDPDERYAVNEVCIKILQAWERENEPCEMAVLVRLLNDGAGRAVKMVREAKKAKGSA